MNEGIRAFIEQTLLTASIVLDSVTPLRNVFSDAKEPRVCERGLGRAVAEAHKVL